MDDDAKPPKIVAENSDRDIALNKARLKAEAALVELTANILRVVRGAGRPYSIGRECADVVEAFQEFHSAAGQRPVSLDVANAIAFFDDQPMSGISDERLSIELARYSIVRGALQIVASHMLSQTTQKRAGESELMSGFRQLTEAREASRRKYERDIKAQRASAKGRGGKGTAATRGGQGN